MATQNSKSSWPYWLIIGVLIGIGIMYLLKDGCSTPKKETIYNTDTVYRDTGSIRFVGPIDFPTKEIKPKTVIVYLDTGKKSPNKFYLDSSTLSSGTLIANPKFIRNFPGSPKLIGGQFTGDTLIMSLMDTSGLLTTKTWPMFYDSYGYLFRDSELLAYGLGKPSIISKPPKTKGITTQGIFDFSYSLLHGGFNFSADYSVMKNRFGLFSRMEAQTYSKYIDFRVGIRYIWQPRKN